MEIVAVFTPPAYQLYATTLKPKINLSITYLIEEVWE